MNKLGFDILRVLVQKPFVNQRILAEAVGCSLGLVNSLIKILIQKDYLDAKMRPTSLALKLIENNSPKNAIILAAGVGMRMVPINMQVPKALIEVYGEPLIERIIKQLHDVGISEIHVVVGFMKEQFEYLIDKFGVNLIVNEEYASKNNLHSLALVSQYLDNTYVIPSDVWCEKNPFNLQELYSWYMVTDALDKESVVRVNRKKRLVTAKAGNKMIGIAYLLAEDSKAMGERLVDCDQNSCYDSAFWEEVLLDGNAMLPYSRIVDSSAVVEINTYEQLRELDKKSNDLKSDAIAIICSSLKVKESEIVDIEVLKKGMTNRSFLFSCLNKRYIMRIPGEGTDQLINRQEESEVYEVIKDKNICDDIIYINPYNGYKITSFVNDARVCDPQKQEDVDACMRCLRDFHNLKLQVGHSFNIYDQLEYYESLWGENQSIYRDYKQTKEQVYELKDYLEKYTTEKVLTHIDAVPDNFLFCTNGQIRLIDWEYAGMQDPHVDIAMFCIYSLYDKEQIDRTIDAYFYDRCSQKIRLKIYCYIAVCGLLWSNWCEYKRGLGVEFGEYSLRQYRYAKDYYRIFKQEYERLRRDEL